MVSLKYNKEPGFLLPGSIYFKGCEYMLKSCKYCGRIHEEKEVCEAKDKASKRWGIRRNTKAFSFRKTNDWTLKSREIRDRDKYCCLCCKAMLIGTTRQLNTYDLSVHHIVPIEEDYQLRLSNENLITLCAVHHEMCEAGEITRDNQRQLVRESIEKFNAEGRGVVVV